jgi:putative ABC transport system permease protein
VTSNSIRWRALFVAVLRESRAARGRLFFFTLCLAIGVAAVVGVSSLVSTMRVGLSSESQDLLAADVRVQARRPLPETVGEFFAGESHRRADLIELGAMASLPEGQVEEGAAVSRLVELKVVEGTYPLYGDLELAPADLAAADLGSHNVFVGPELANELDLEVDDELMVGGAAFRVAAIVVDEPDRLDFAMTLGPRVFVGTAGYERTNLQGEKSRVKYVSLYALEGDTSPERIDAVEQGLINAIEGTPYVRIKTHTDAQPNVTRALTRVEDYLGLVALLSLLLGGIGVSQIVRAWLVGRTQGVAVMRCLGFRAREIAAMFLGHVAMLAVLGCLIGGVIGAGLPWVVRLYAPELFQGADLPIWQPVPVFRGVALGLFVATLFSMLPLTAVWRVAPAAVLRAEAVPLAAPKIVRYGAPVLMLLGVLLSARIQSGSWLPALAFTGGLFVLAAALFAGAWLAAGLSSRLPRGKFGPYLEHGLAALSRPGAGTTGAIVALGMGVMVVLSMWLIESRLGHYLRTALPKDAPSVFLVDVQPQQWDGVRSTMESSGVRSLNSVPVVMARLRNVGGRPVRELAEEAKEQRRSYWIFTREQRLTWMDALPDDNEIVHGTLWSDPERAEVSLEEGFAEDMGASVGTVLELDILGFPLELVVTSIRKVDWQSFNINFFFVVEPGVLEEAPHFRIAAGRLDEAPDEIALQNALAGDFPNVTMIRVRPLLEKIAGVLERLAFGIRALGSFTILAGLVILAGSIGSTALRRAREAALLKALGVTRGGVTRLFAFEYALSGLVAGALGSIGALALSWAFLTQLAELDPDLPWIAIPITTIGTALLASLSGLSASLRSLSARPMETLRS